MLSLLKSKHDLFNFTDLEISMLWVKVDFKTFHNVTVDSLCGEKVLETSVYLKKPVIRS